MHTDLRRAQICMHFNSYMNGRAKALTDAYYDERFQARVYVEEAAI